MESRKPKALRRFAPSPCRGEGSDGGAGILPTVCLRGVRFHAVTERECVEYIIGAAKERRGGWAVTPNVDILRRCGQDSGFRRMIDEADLVLADGMPLVWASRLAGTPLPQRVAGSTLFPRLCGAAAESDLSIYLLGGSPGAAAGAASVLVQRHPTLRIAGIECPPFGFERRPEHLPAIRARLRQAQPDIVFVALGSPKQEQLIRQVREVAPGAWWIGVGISFSFLCGQVRRAPDWMQRAGLEWMHRLFQQPTHLARRYLVDDLPFALSLLLSSAAARGRRDPT